MIMLYDRIEQTDEVGNVLKNCQKSIVKQELNGSYLLTFETTETIKKWAMLKASTPEGLQPFFVENVQKKNDTYDITAKHMTYLADKIYLRGFEMKRGSVSDISQNLNTALARNAMGLPFVVEYDSSLGSHQWWTEDSTVGEAILARDGVANVWQSKLYRDGFRFKLGAKKGRERNELLARRKNLIDCNDGSSIKDVATRLHLSTDIYLKDSRERRTLRVIVDSPLINKYPLVFEKAIKVVNNDITTEEQLREHGLKLFEDGLDKPKEVLEVKATNTLKDLQIGDSVLIYYEDDDVYSRIDFIAYEYDPIAEEYITQNFGDLPITLDRVVAKKIEEGTTSISDMAENAYQQSQENMENIDSNYDSIGSLGNQFNEFESDMNSRFERTNEYMISEYTKINKELTDKTTELRSLITQTAESIRLEVEKIETQANKNKRDIASLDIRADSITSKVESVERYAENLNNTVYNNYTELKQTANSISSTVYSVKSTADSAYTIASRVEQKADGWGVWVNSVRPVLYVAGGGIGVNGSVICDQVATGTVSATGVIQAASFYSRAAGSSW